MPTRVPASPRLAAVTVLLGFAVLALKAPRTPARPAPVIPDEGATFPVAALLALAIPAIVLATIAALRLGRRPAPPAPEHPTRRRPHRWLAAAILLALLAGTITAAALAARLAGTTPNSERAAAPTTTPLPAVSDPSATPYDDQGWLLIAALVLLALLAAAALAHRQNQEADPPGPNPALVRAVERARIALGDPASDPRTAIVRCYAVMEGALTAVPAAAPHAADSPSEVLDRALTAGAVRSRGAWRLVELFGEARFSPHPMTETDRADATSALELILNELRRRR